MFDSSLNSTGKQSDRYFRGRWFQSQTVEANLPRGLGHWVLCIIFIYPFASLLNVVMIGHRYRKNHFNVSAFQK
jgi:hypothetical protein